MIEPGHYLSTARYHELIPYLEIFSQIVRLTDKSFLENIESKKPIPAYSCLISKNWY